MKRLQSFLLIFFLAGLAGCSAIQPGEPLNGTSWTLSQLNGHSLLSGSRISISFSDGSFSGTAGCNQYGGSYQTLGGSFSTGGSVEMTAMACLTPEGIMDQEQEFTSALGSAAAFEVNGGQMEMMDADGETVLVFVLEPSARDVDPESLASTEWQVRNVGGGSLIPGSQITMLFTRPGEVSGFGGCRGYQATYLQTEEGIRFTSIAMNEEVCNDEDLLLQEQDFTDYLSNAAHLEMLDGLLILTTQQGVKVVFEEPGE